MFFIKSLSAPFKYHKHSLLIPPFYFQASLTEASRALYESLDGEAYLDEVTIEVPFSWTEMDCKLTLSPACLAPSARKVNIFGAQIFSSEIFFSQLIHCCPDNAQNCFCLTVAAAWNSKSFRALTQILVSLGPQITGMKETEINCETVYICHLIT